MPVQSFKVGEMLNKRTPNSKTWINFDGSYTTEIHQGIIHYEDASGNLHNINTDLFDEADFNEIDFPVAKDGDSLFYEQQAKATKDKKKNRLNRENYDFQGLAVPYECRIPRNIRRGYSIGKGASKLKFIPVGASVSKGYAEGNKITYPDVWNDADLVLELLPEGIKETIILKTDKAPINFSFEVQGELAQELKIQPMWLMDAEGTKRDVLQGVSEVDDKVLLNIAADTSNLVYPIEVDPTVTITMNPTAGKDAWVYSGSPNSNLGTSFQIGLPPVGGTYYQSNALAMFDLSTIPVGAVGISATLNLKGYGGSENYLFVFQKVYAYVLNALWDENTVTWNNKPGSISSGLTTYSGNPQNSNLTAHSFSGGGLINYITAYAGQANNPGFMLQINETPQNFSQSLTFASKDDGVLQNRPSLTVTYNAPPTAPVVTAPNGGETWNSSHTVAWTASKDKVETGVLNTGGAGAHINTITLWSTNPGEVSGQTFLAPKTFYMDSVDFVLYNYTANTPFDVQLYSLVGGVPSTLLLSERVSFSEGTTNAEKRVSCKFSNPYQLQNGVGYAIIFSYVSGANTTLSLTSNTYANGSHVFKSGGTTWTINTTYDHRITIYEYTTNLQYQIQLSTNNGSAWKDIVALTAAGATSYPYDFINEAETSTALIRVRAYDGSAYGPWDTSNGVFTIVHNQAPTAPTGLSPSGEPKDKASVVRFGWLHNDPNAGDPQSKFDLQWRVQGSPTWNTVTQATTNNYYDMPAGTLPKGTVEWQVRTYDQAGLPSPYSALQVFIAGDKPPTPTITGPVNGSVVPVSKPVVQWSSVDQAGYQVNVQNASGSTTLWTTGQVNSGNKAVTVGIDLENNTDYRIQTLVRGAEGIWSDAAISNINVSYTPPALPVLDADVHSTAGTITINISNPVPQGTEPTVTSNDLYRREVGNVNWERIADNLGNNDSYTDYTVASDQVYEYRVIAYGDNGTFRESTLVNSSVTLKGIYLHVISNAENTSKRFLMGEQKGSSTWNLNHAFHKFAGRQNFVIDTEDSTEYGVDFTIKLRNAEERKALESIIYSQEVVCFRDGRGRKVFGVFVTFPLEDAFWGESTSLNLTRIDYKEEVL
ncbi:DNRLRE domain-containing protein [Fictibacillus sp. 23RED33]|uniref:DNRLRE domain-containing protein n=1 Tax=Fictibacillus sp. 23RED33 TaxID=2745879 RepID=UPI0018CCC637|nr:DNRLRE domain-containing protein [Fictibacillus sp. 23RED33]MBH0174708.1 DNRLRE domain-containing protein [Fictibacillus sp. 23RED33]